MSCLGKISADISRPTIRATKGLEQNAVIINYEDLPKTGISEDVTDPNELLTGLALNSGTSGYNMEFPCAKAVLKFTVEAVENENTEDGYRHILPDLVWPDISKAGLAQLNKMDGGRFYVVAEGKWKGDSNADAFWFFGRHIGLIMKVTSWNSEENSGLPLVTFETPATFDEPYVPCKLLDAGDYATTKTAFDNKFAAA